MDMDEESIYILPKLQIQILEDQKRVAKKLKSFERVKEIEEMISHIKKVNGL